MINVAERKITRDTLYKSWCSLARNINLDDSVCTVFLYLVWLDKEESGEWWETLCTTIAQYRGAEDISTFSITADTYFNALYKMYDISYLYRMFVPWWTQELSHTYIEQIQAVQVPNNIFLNKFIDVQGIYNLVIPLNTVKHVKEVGMYIDNVLYYIYDNVQERKAEADDATLCVTQYARLHLHNKYQTQINKVR